MASFGTDFNAAYGLGFHPSQFEENPMSMQQSLQPPQSSQQQYASMDPRAPIAPITREPVKQPPPFDGERIMQQAKYDQDVSSLQKELHKYNEGSNDSRGGYYHSSPSFLDNMWARRREILKLVTLSLIILLAISTHVTADHFLKKYILESDLSERNEMLTRIAYPAGVLLIIWLIKSSASK